MTEQQPRPTTGGDGVEGTVFLTGPDLDTALAGLWWDDEDDAKMHAYELGEQVFSVTARLDASTAELVYDPNEGADDDA
jgi:hypothetical protein